ncbi:MAG TPA: phage holin family protein, partial [Verrucomicrobiae bacterium]|nr:phage holin family protein [Verrucomicrobiae bacterium]
MPLELKKFIQSWAVNTLAVLVAVFLMPGHIHYDKAGDLLMASLLLGILNAFLRPVLMLLALPLLILSLGLFMLVINAFMLYFVGSLVPGFHVAGFWWA